MRSYKQVAGDAFSVRGRKVPRQVAGFCGGEEGRGEGIVACYTKREILNNFPISGSRVPSVPSVPSGNYPGIFPAQNN